MNRVPITIEGPYRRRRFVRRQRWGALLLVLLAGLLMASPFIATAIVQAVGG